MKTNPNSHRVGNFGEQLAARYLRFHGYAVKERNYRAGHHEIDVIATRWGVIAFVEVKARSYREADAEIAPPPGNAVGSEKQRLTRKAAKDYLWLHHSKKQPRMDVIEVWLVKDEKSGKSKVAKINHIKGAY